MRFRRHAGLLVVALTAAGCLPQGLAFRTDERVTITSPDDRETVSLPVTITWTVDGFDLVEPGAPAQDDAGYFAVFVDRAPVSPGERFDSVADGDAACRGSCPDAAYLAQRGIYATTATQVVIESVELDDDDRSDRHTATIVLVDGAGRRIGESAFDVTFEIEDGLR